MIVMQLNTIALRLSERRGSEVIRPRTTAASSTPGLSFAPDSPTMNMLLRTASLPVKAWFHSWVAGVPISRYRTLPSYAVFQLLYAVHVVVQTQSPEPDHTFSGYESAISRSSPMRGASSSAPLAPEPGSDPLDDAVTVMNRLIALDTKGTDVYKFWAALGETHEAELAPGSAAAEQSSTSDDFPRPGNNVCSAMMAGASPGSQSSFGNSCHLLQSQMSPPHVFIPPSGGVGSVRPGGRPEYQDPARLPPIPNRMPALGGGSQPSDPNQRTANELWDVGSCAWAGFGGSPTMMVHEEGIINQHLWEPGCINPLYGWGDGY